MPIVQENPTYFSDSVAQLSSIDPADFYSNDSSIRRHNAFGGSSSDASPKVTNGTSEFKQRGRTKLLSDDSELEVFLSSCESNTSYSTFSESSNDEMSKKEGSKTNPSNFSKGLGLGQKLGQFFWSKSKSKSSLGNQSEESCSTSGVGSSSSRCTPDSSLSMCASSLESHNGNGNVSLINDQTALYRFDDCERYAANMYYNCSITGGDSTSYTLRMKPRNYSVPSEGSSLETKRRNNEIEDCVQPYYNNMTFSTFPNPRRHSIASSSISNSSRGRKNKRTNSELDGVIEQDRDGYLRPKEPQNFRNNLSHQHQAYYINEPGGSNNCGNTSRVQVQVDVHHGSHKVSSLGRPSVSEEEESLEETSATTLTTENSQASTVVAWTGPSVGASWKKTLDDQSLTGDDEWKKKHAGTIHPMYLGRFGNDCEPYCSLCTSTSMLAANSKKSRMDVAIVSCQECFFSKEAEALIRTFFDKFVTADKQKLDVSLQSYDLKDLDRTSVATSVHRAKVQIVVISHHFLQRLKLEASTRARMSPVNRVFRSKRVIAVLFGVDQKEVSEGYEGVMTRFSEWFCVELRSTSKLDPEFRARFTDQVVKIYNVELSNTNNFSVFPKKVTKDQGKIVLTLKKPTEAGDDVRVEFTCGRRKEMMRQLKMENPYQSLIRIPGNLSPDKTSLIEVVVYVNSQKLGATWLKYEAHNRHGDEDWIERMGNLIPGYYNLLDEHLSQTLSKNFRDCTDFSTDPNMEIINDVLVCKEDEFPTVLHFAAYYGLHLTAYTVLSEADGLEQCQVKNDMEESPLDVAIKKGHENITKLFGEYQYVSDSWKALRYIRDIIGRSSMPPPSSETLKVHKLEINLNGSSLQHRTNESNQSQLDYVNVSPSEFTNDAHEIEIASKINGNSDGSYVEIPDDLIGAVSTTETNDTCNLKVKIQDPMHSYEIPPPPIPAPRPKSPRRKSYVNLQETAVDAPSDNYVNINADTLSENNANVNVEASSYVNVSGVGDASSYVNVNGVGDAPSEKSNDDADSSSSAWSENTQTEVTRRTKGSKVDSSRRRSIKPNLYSNIMDHGFSDTDSLDTSEPVNHVGVSDYLTPRPQHLDYQIPPPEARPVYPEPHDTMKDSISDEEDTLITSPVLKTKVNSIPKGKDGYWILDGECDNDLPAPDSQKDDKVDDAKPNGTSPSTGIQKKPLDRSASAVEPFLDSCDLDLIQLMEDFKRDALPLQQLELLYEHWKSRPDVQVSFQEKKENLKKIQNEYKKLQGKKTFFDKVASALGRKKSHSLASSSPLTTPPPMVLDDHTVKPPESPVFSRFDARNLSKSRSTDLESESSHGSFAGANTALSECGSDNAFESAKPTHVNPLSKRFNPSYIYPSYIAPKDVPNFVLKSPVPPRTGDKPVIVDPSKAVYDQPPPPRPVESPTTSNYSSAPPSPGPPGPSKPQPAKRGQTNGNGAPPIPEKPSHMKYKGETNLGPSSLNEEIPPPPPLRSYKPPNVFNYIDYKKKEK